MNTKRGVRGAFPSINAACFSLGELDTEAGRGGKNRAAALCPSILWPGARRTPTKRERERAGEYMGQIFPWQDPWDAAEGRVQPVKERLRARQSISGLHLHNKWSSRGFSSACTRTRTHTAHQHTPTQGRRDEEEGERKRAAFLLEWHYLAAATQASASILLDDTVAKLQANLLRQIYSRNSRKMSSKN